MKKNNFDYRPKQLFKKQITLHMFVLSGIIYLLIFSYVPMFGLIMGFKNYDIIMGVKGIFTSEWVGLKYFKEFVNDYLSSSNRVCCYAQRNAFTEIQEGCADMQLSSTFYILGHNIRNFVSFFLVYRNNKYNAYVHGYY